MQALANHAMMYAPTGLELHGRGRAYLGVSFRLVHRVKAM
jgi:hypothetical protein